MARQDFSKLLGRRVGYVSPSFDGEPSVYFTGYILGYMEYAEGAECFADFGADVLFHGDADPHLKPDFISSSYNFHLLD